MTELRQPWVIEPCVCTNIGDDGNNLVNILDADGDLVACVDSRIAEKVRVVCDLIKALDEAWRALVTVASSSTDGGGIFHSQMDMRMWAGNRAKLARVALDKARGVKS